MQFKYKDTHIDFLRWINPAIILSVVLTVVALGSLAVRGLNFGLDFTGGLLLEMQYPTPTELTQVRDTLAEAGYGDATVQHFGTAREVMIRLPPREGVTSAELTEQVSGVLRQAEPQLQLLRQEFVGPQVGEELAEDGGLALLLALIGILIYVSLRFQYRLAIGAVLSLAHDAIIVIGIFSLLGLNFDLTVLAAVLAVIGYSLNDTIVIYDRIRENFRKMRKGTVTEIINASINQTLSRTINTSGTTLMVVLALLLLGGEMIHNFALALFIGIAFGTYSSIYVAAGAVIKLGISREDLLPVPKEGADVDTMP
jgi:preprotein translocase subunit SecF